MLFTAAPFPHVGCFALLTDIDLPPEQQRPELVRVLERGGTMVHVAFPLRSGAGGNKVVPADDLADPTPLTIDEQRTLTDLERGLRGTSGRTASQKQRLRQANQLRERLIHSQLAAPLLVRARVLAAKQRRAA